MSLDPAGSLLIHRAPEGLLQRAVARYQVQDRRSSRLVMALAASVLIASGTVFGWTVRDILPDTQSQEAAAVPVRLALHAPDAQSVAVAGTWNEWAPVSLTPATSHDGTFQIVLMVPQGRHEYMFLVDGLTWVVDPNATLLSDDDFGMVNAILDV